MTWDGDIAALTYEQPPPDVVEALAAIFAAGHKPTVPEVAPFVRALYDAHCTGGSLHIVLDDGNVRDSDVEFCAEWARDHGDRFGELLAAVLLRMSKTQREKLSLG